MSPGFALAPLVGGACGHCIGSPVGMLPPVAVVGPAGVVAGAVAGVVVVATGTHYQAHY